MTSIFSRIIAGEIPSYRVAEDEKHYAFLDIHPIVKGHTLVVPKREEEYIYDLSDTELSDLQLFAKKVAVALKQATGCKRIAVMVLGMEVPHVHIHLLPINSEADIDLRRKFSLSPEEFTEIASKIIKYLQI